MDAHLLCVVCNLLLAQAIFKRKVHKQCCKVQKVEFLFCEVKEVAFEIYIAIHPHLFGRDYCVVRKRRAFNVGSLDFHLYAVVCDGAYLLHHILSFEVERCVVFCSFRRNLGNLHFQELRVATFLLKCITQPLLGELQFAVAEGYYGVRLVLELARFSKIESKVLAFKSFVNLSLYLIKVVPTSDVSIVTFFESIATLLCVAFVMC